MKKRGFTLVEMLGVMTLLAVIFALIYPNITNMLEKGKENEIKEYESNIFLATEAYINSDKNLSSQLINEGDEISVNFNVLLQSGYLSSNIVDPKTGESVTQNPSNKKVTVTVTNKKFIYSITSEE